MDRRYDIRDRDPGDDHRAAFLAGWTDAVKGRLYETTVLSKKTHANMGNLFGWIYGDQDREFRLETWYRYLGRSLDKPEATAPPEEDPSKAMAGVDEFEPPLVDEVVGANRARGSATDIGHVNPKRQRVIRRVGPSPTLRGKYTYELECLDCGHRYGTNGADIDGAGQGTGRKCPNHDGGVPGDPID